MIEMDGRIQTMAENYFLQTNYSNRRILEDIIHVRESYEDTWHQLTQHEKDQALDDEIILPEVALKHALGQNKQHTNDPPQIKSFPKLRVKSGQKIVEEEDLKTGEKTKYRDEHSGPFSWKTRSQQDLSLDLTPVNLDASLEEGQVVVAARRSAILSCPFNQYSRIPKTAKPVAIPVVPDVGRPVCRNSQDDDSSCGGIISDGNVLHADSLPSCIEEVTSMASSIVIAQEDNLVLDFSQPLLPSSESAFSTASSTPRSGMTGSSSLAGRTGSSSSAGSSTPREDTSLLGKMKDRTLSLKKNLTPTLRRKKSSASTETGSTFLCDSVSILSSDGEITPTKLPTNKVGSRAVSCHRPTAPPPPPPPQGGSPTLQQFGGSEQAPVSSSSQTGGVPAAGMTRKTGPPPAPPTRNPFTRISSRPASMDDIVGDSLESTNTAAINCTEANTADTKSSEIEQKSTPTSTEAIAKTGFDFLDNW